ncbi:hypothetical protein OR16_21813 [Cupriavidus basilensis OR16]|uniref:Uncharacterized protein n=1 Tax=Cupriavidus basilensis OR16 TaxID=1127483 RepID=H1S8P1_9BURK|nr:DUF6081 family protein [Cupriavidus basilensis]EHP41083.1 hypothetical protein OR16_21813 [Cupriavidus basilensis OR16]
MNARPLDTFSSGAPDPSLWGVLEMPMPDGGMWKYEEPARRHDHVPMFDNPKHFLAMHAPLQITRDGAVTIGCEMACENHNGNPGDLFDGFAGFNVCDLANGLVFDFIISATRIGVVHERLPIPGVTPPGGDWLHIVQSPLVAQNHPGEFHRYEITIDRGARTCEWHVDGKPIYATRLLAADVECVVPALGLFTLKPAMAGRGSVSNHGQGATGRWKNLCVRGAREA